MNYLTNLLFSVTLLSCFSFIMSQRKLYSERAPGCKEFLRNCDTINLFYTKAVGENDTVHYVWDFTTKPSLLLAYTYSNVTMNIDWPAFLKNEVNSIQFSSSVIYGFLIIIDELIEFEDVNDTGFFTEGARNISFPSDSFAWNYSKALNAENASDFVFHEMVASNGSTGNISVAGTISIQLSAFGSSSHDNVLPRLLHSSNSSQVKVILQGMNSNANLTNRRWAVKLTLLSTSPKREKFLVESKKNLDDENSPGVFTIVNILNTRPENDSLHTAYLQWRPVVYTSETPSISNSSDVDIMDLTVIPNPKTNLNGTLATKLFNTELSDMLVENTIVSFGSSQDGFYQRTNYSSWAFLISYGEPQTEGFSKLVILVMTIGLGLPALLIFVGGVFMCSRRLCRRNDELSFEH